MINSDKLGARFFAAAFSLAISAVMLAAAIVPASPNAGLLV